MPPPSTATSQQRVVASLTAIALVAAFAVVIVAAGHGVGPVGLLLVLGSFSAWGLHMVIGWVGVLLTLAALFCSRVRLHVGLAVGGLVFLAVAWVLFLTASEDPGLTLMTATPFLVLSAVRGFQLWKLSTGPASSGDAPRPRSV